MASEVEYKTVFCGTIRASVSIIWTCTQVNCDGVHHYYEVLK